MLHFSSKEVRGGAQAAAQKVGYGLGYNLAESGVRCRTPLGASSMPLTDTAIRAAKPSSKPFKLYDRDGLFLLVNTGGSRLWRWRYRFDSKEKLLALGEYPVVSLVEARERHLRCRKTLASGVDPMAERKAQTVAKQEERLFRQRQADLSFEKIASAWWEWWSIGKSPRHATTVLRRLRADVLPAFGHKFIDDVSTSDVREVMLSIEHRDARDVAKRAHESTGQIFRYAIARGLATRNPAAEFKPRDILAAARTENFARIEAKDLPELLSKIEGYNGDALTRLGLRLIAYTFVRTSELIEAPWPEFDLEKAVWIIPAERMKMSTPHIVPLARQAVEVLRALRLLTGRGHYVFPGANDKSRPMSNNTLLYALYRLGYRGRMTGHGFRGLASTILHENGFEEAHIELQLAHLRRNTVAAAYNHAKHVAQRSKMMQWWADYLDAQVLVGTNSSKPALLTAA